VTASSGQPEVTLSSGGPLTYDRLVLAPGVEFIYEQGLGIPGLESTARTGQGAARLAAGAQTTALRNQITAMPSGGVSVLTIPPNLRCPPGPYERACLVATWLKKKPAGSKVIILDANPASPRGALVHRRLHERARRGDRVQQERRDPRPSTPRR